MRVMHVLHPGPTGGLEQVVEQLAGGRAREGRPTAAVMTCFAAGQATGLETKLRASGVRVKRVEVGGRDYWGERRQIAAFAKSWQAEVIHSHGYRADIVSWGIAQAIGGVSVSTAHGFTGGDLRNRLYERLQQWAWRGVDTVVAVSEPLRARLVNAGVPERKVAVVRNAWSGGEPALNREQAREELGIAGPRCWIGWVGRLSAEKAPELMLRALSGLPASVGLVMVGDGRERASLEALAQSLGIAGRVRFAGLLPDAAQRMKAFDLLVLSSRTEGTPMVLLEAMAAQVPVAATRVGGVPQMLNEREAYLAEPEAESLTFQIQLALSDSTEAQRRASAARRRLEQSAGRTAWMAAYESLYRSGADASCAQAAVSPIGARHNWKDA